tara:strand:- start:1876 stop:2058 length:183 start_codon:yes stop_codon:yes gene_type:complete
MSIEHVKFETMKEDEGTVIAEMLTLTSLLEGEMHRYTTYDSTGKTSKKIVIEYDVKNKSR